MPPKLQTVSMYKILDLASQNLAAMVLNLANTKDNGDAHWPDHCLCNVIHSILFYLTSGLFYASLGENRNNRDPGHSSAWPLPHGIKFRTVCPPHFRIMSLIAAS
jgi:hypothetical protein